MESAFYNEKYFDFELLKIPGSLIRVETENSTYAYDTCLRSAQRKETVILITERGYAVHAGVDAFLKKTRYKYYHSICSPNNKMKSILTTFLQQEIPYVVQFTYATENDLASSFIYLVKEDILHRKRNVNRVMILKNIDTLNITSWSTIGRLISELKGVVGILCTISSTGFESLKIKGEEYTDIGDLVTHPSVQWETMPPPKRGELIDYLVARGVLAERLTKKLSEKYPNFSLLDWKIEEIKRKLKEKGFLIEDI